MGKVKRSRQKVHRAAQKERAEKPANEAASADTEDRPPAIKETWDTQSNVFKNIKIDTALLHQALPDFDARSGVTNKSLKDLNLSKKSKQKLRHELWIQKLDAVAAAKKNDKEKRKRQQTAIVGDMQPLQDCLPTLERLMADRHHKPQSVSAPKPKAVATEKQRKKQQMQDMAVFAQVIQHSAFKEKPLATIKEHLQNRIKLEDGMDMA